MSARATAQAPTAAAPSPPPLGREVEQNLVNLPTTQPLRRFSHHFRITHRFARDLRRGSFGQLASDLFGLDSGAIIGLDYRFSPATNLQLGVYRSMLFRTIQTSARYDVWQQAEMQPLSFSIVGSVEGANNMRDDHAPAVGLVASWGFGPVLALYAAPTFVWHSQTPGGTAVDHDHEHADGALDAEHPHVEDESTGYVGLGARLRVRPTAFLVLEFTPRVAGHSPGRGVWGVAIEKQTSGHLFQINLSNSFGTTIGQLARGGEPANVYLGFNLARKW